MPVAGDEGYEAKVVCPYDRAHEIRRGRMQFHLEKCRKNHLDSDARYEKCILNSNHTIPSVEMEYHINYECDGRKDWLRNQVDLDRVPCPVGDLVSVNAGTVPDCEESWDHIEGNGSVLDKIKQEAADKPILRIMQCESKAKRKTFRLQEKLRYNKFFPDSCSTSSSVQGDEPPVMPRLKTNICVKRQEPEKAMETLNKVFKTVQEYPALNTASNFSAPSTRAPSSTNDRPSTSGSYASMASPSTSRQTPVSVDQRPISAASSYTSMTSTAAGSSSNRKPTIAMNIAASANRMGTNPSDEGFSTVPIPGRGRGRRIDARGLPQE